MAILMPPRKLKRRNQRANAKNIYDSPNFLLFRKRVRLRFVAPGTTFTCAWHRIGAESQTTSYAPSLTSTLSIGSKIPGELPDSSGYPETISEFSIERSHRLDGGRCRLRAV